MNTDSLVNKILAKNAPKRPELVINILKYHGLDAVHVFGSKYKIKRRHEWQYQAQDAAREAKKILLNECPELHVKNVEAYAECFRSVVEFEI